MQMTPVAHMSWAVLLIGLIVVGFLVCASIGTVVGVLMKVNNKTISPRKAAPHLVGLVWILPVVAVCLFLVAPFFLVIWSVSSDRIVSHSQNEAVLTSSQSVGSVTVKHELVHDETLASPMPGFPGPTTKRISASTTSSAERPIGAQSVATELPAWVLAGEINSENSRSLVLASEQFAKVDRARQNVLREAVRVVLKDFQRTHNGLGSWTLPDALVQQHAVRQEYVEEIARTTDLNTFLVYRVYYQVELSPTVRAAVFENWRGQTVTSRLWMLGGLLGFVTLMLGTTATYLRLDAMTNGAYRRRLKLASVSLLVAGGLVLAAKLPLS